MHAIHSSATAGHLACCLSVLAPCPKPYHKQSLIPLCCCKTVLHKGLGILQEKQIRGKQAMKQLSDRMRDQRVQVADRVRKHVAAARILPKVVSTAGLFLLASVGYSICPTVTKSCCTAVPVLSAAFCTFMQISGTTLCPIWYCRWSILDCSADAATDSLPLQEQSVCIMSGLISGGALWRRK